MMMAVHALRRHGVPIRWDALIQAWEPPQRFVDVQVRGSCRLWHHTHEVQARVPARLS
jgi:ligand-binding SRPBCC domain-containing protein